MTDNIIAQVEAELELTPEGSKIMAEIKQFLNDAENDSTLDIRYAYNLLAEFFRACTPEQQERIRNAIRELRENT